MSDGSDSAPNGEETFGLDSDGRPGNDSPLRGRDEPVDGVAALPEEEPALLEVGNVGEVALGSEVPVAGNVGTASSGTPMSPNGMKGSARGAPTPTAGVPLPDVDDPPVVTAGTAADGTLKRRNTTGSERPEPIDTDGSAAATR